MSAAVVVTAAYANVAQAGLPGLTGQSDPVATTVATGTSTVEDVTNTVTGTVDSATSSIGPTDGGVAGSTTGTVTDAVSSTTQAVSSTAQAVSDTPQAVSTTVDQTVATAEAAVDSVVSGPQAATEQTVPQVARVVAVPSTPSASAAPPVPTTAPETMVDEPIAPATMSGSPGKAVVALTHVGAAPVAPTRTSNATRPARSRPSAPFEKALRTMTATPEGPPRSDGQPVLQRAPRAPLPSLPSSVSSPLVGSGMGSSLVVAALLGILLIAAFGRSGGRVRPHMDVFRPPDVLFQLERPG